MDTSTDKLIQDQFNSLPPEVREALTRVPWKDRIRDIAKREGLDQDKSLALETETLLVLYGFSPTTEYVENIVSQVGVEEEQAERISKMVSDEIVADIEKQFDLIEAQENAVGVKAEFDEPEASTPPQEAAPSAEESKKDLLDIPPEILAKQIFLPEVPPETLPETLPGEVAHDVPPAEVAAVPEAPAIEPAAPKTPPLPEPPTVQPIPEMASTLAAMPEPEPMPVPTPKSIIEEKLSRPISITPPTSAANSYPRGQDPYREPAE